MMRHLPFVRRHRTALRFGAPALVAGVAVLALFVLEVPVPRGVAHYVRDTLVPAQQSAGTLGAQVHALSASIGSKASLVRENTRLHEEVSLLRRQSFMADVYRAENERLRTELYGDTSREDSVPANVLVALSRPYDALSIDVGESSGLTRYALVTVSGGVALGYLDDVSEHSALVRLFSTPGTLVEVLVGSGTTTRLVAEGKGAGALSVRVPRNVHVAVGDPVTLPLRRPQLLATVRALEGTASDPFVTAWFSIPVVPQRARTVFVSRTALWQPYASDDVLQAP